MKDFCPKHPDSLETFTSSAIITEEPTSEKKPTSGIVHKMHTGPTLGVLYKVSYGFILDVWSNDTFGNSPCLMQTTFIKYPENYTHKIH